MSHAVIIKNAVKKYGDFTALNGVSLDIKQGEFFTLLGPSGCGKTTLLRMIAGFNTVDGGEICFDDRVINNLEAHKRDIGMVFQNYAIFPHLTVAENVAYGLKAKKCPKDQIPGKVEEALELVQIGKLKDRKPNELSGGQQQRVALARAFVIEPGVLLMDEPLSNLDAKLRSDMRSELISLHEKLQSTFIYVTHDQIEAMTMGTNVVILDKGRVMQQGKPGEVHNDPNCVFVAKFIGDPGMNIIECASGYKIGFRPRDVIFDCGRHDSDTIIINDKISSFENHGSEFLYLVDIDGQKIFVKEMSKARRQIGEILTFGISKKNIYVFDEQEKRVYDEETIDRVYREFKNGREAL